MSQSLADFESLMAAFKYKKVKAAERKVKRADNVAYQRAANELKNGPRMPKEARKAPGVPRSLKSAQKRGPLAKKIVRLLGLLDRKKNGPFCRIHGSPCLGTLAYHLIPQSRGDSTRFLPEAVIWACRGANFGEHHHRSLYRDKHIAIYGKEYIEALEAKAREIVHLKMWELRELHDRIKTQVEAP